MNNSRQLNLILKLKDEVSGSLDKVNSKMQSMQPTFQKMAAIGTASFLAIGAGILKTTQDAAKAEGSWNKFYTVFGDGAEDMTEFINEIRKEMPSATHEIARMSADLQDLLIPMGLSRTASMGMTKEMVTLANKLAAFNDVDPTEVLNAFKSGLSGSSEPLRRFGINALDSTLEAHALEKGIGGMKDGFLELSPLVLAQVKAQSLISLAYEQSGDAIAGFEANNDSLIRRQQALQATIKETSVTIGNIFLPIIDDLVKKISPIIEKFSEWVEENPKLAKNIILVSLALSGLVAGIGFLGLIITPIIVMFSMLTVAMLPLIATIAVVTLVFGALAVYWVKNFDTMMMGVDVFMEGWTKFMDDVILGADVVEEQTNRMAKSWRNYFDDVISGTNVVEEGFSNFVNNASEVNNSATARIGTAWNLLFDNLYLGIQVAFEGITKFLTGGANLIITIFESMANSIINSINGILSRINKVAKRLESFGIDVPTIQLLSNLKIPRLAEGGVVTKPTLAMIGEGNESEAVLPLSKLNKFSGGGGVTINISTMVGEEEYAEKMGDKIIQSLKQNQLLTSL